MVAVGASAGGLEALEQLFSALSSGTGAAFVVIQHLAPDHKSLMVELLQRYTAMPVRLVEDGMTLERDTVYLIPPAKLMTLAGERLRLAQKPPHTLTLPIDVFLASLAQERGTGAVAVILSGTGSDGSRGGLAVKAAGGLVLVQDPVSAKFDGMPRSAMAAGLGSDVLTPAALAGRLASHLAYGGPATAGADPAGLPDPASPDDAAGDLTLDDDSRADLAAILVQLSGTTGIDFREYKPGTLGRQVMRRMSQRGITRLADFRALLQGDADELQALGRELLIPVTQFYRDRDAFDLLRTEVVAPLVAQREHGQTLRVWCAGVSTGQEAYSIGSLFLEAFEAARKWPALKIFATDISQERIDFAARGVYTEAEAAGLPPSVRERYFEPCDGGLHVRPALRQCIVFARQDLINDPPFTRMDLVVCRNALIYFGPDAQTRALRRLQYALSLHGVLFLGRSESLGALETDFLPIDRAQKIWRLLRPASHPTPRSGGPVPSIAPRARPLTPARQALQRDSESDAAMAVLREAYPLPPAVLLNSRHEVVHSYGAVGQFLSLRPGLAGLDLSRLLPEELTPFAMGLLSRLAREGAAVRTDVLSVALPAGGGDAGEGGGRRLMRLSAWPVPAPDEARMALLVFETVRDPAGTAPGAEAVLDVGAETVQRMEMLESELALTRENLQRSIEELETSNEELQTTNEELMASNEELQSTNEELQSVNEELNTINAEYQEKIEFLDRVNADLDGLTRVAAAGAIFVDDALQVSRFSPDAPQVFRVREQDIGRPIADLTHDLHYPELYEDLRRCVRGASPFERDVPAGAGRHFLVKMLPYQVPSSGRRAAVLSFVESTKVHEATQLQNILDALAEHVAVLDRSGRIRMVNAAWRRFAAENGDPELRHCGPGADYLRVCEHANDSREQGDARRAANGLQAVLDGRSDRFTMEYPCHSPGRNRWFVMHVRPLFGEHSGAVVSHIDISPWVERSDEA